MFYKPTLKRELSRKQLEAAQRAFRGKLLRLGYPPEFIVRNCDECLAMGYADYVRALDRGVRVREPGAFIVHAAWQRLQNLLHAEGYRPKTVSADTVLQQIDGEEPSPEELLEVAERERKVHEAVEKLSEDQKKVVALTFFEELSIREAAKHLEWSAGKVQHHHRTALEHLRRFLPVRSSDELEVDIGMAASGSAIGGAAGHHIPAGIELLAEKTSEAGSGIWARAHDLARRFSLGASNDAASAVASTGAGRTAGACATGLVVVCLAGAGAGAIPGVGPAIFGGGERQPLQHRAQLGANSGSIDRAGGAATSATDPALQSPAATGESASQATTPNSAKPSPTPQSRGRVEAREVRNQTSGIARAASESKTPSSTELAEASGTSSESASVTTVTTEPSQSSAAAASSRQQAASEFQPVLHP